jgi:pimeloyl-ACP methyl ester carboxylesterase
VHQEDFTLSATNPTRYIVLRDGRRLAYEEQGDPAGQPVFLFHGAPGSRLQRHPDASIAQRLGVRIITVDRPGYGLSDPKPNRRFLDWPDDVVQLADGLGIERFAVAGFSGGAPFAAACGYKLPRRVTRVALVSCPAPFEVPGMRESLERPQRLQITLASRAPWAVRLMFGWYFRAVRNVTPDAVRQKLKQELPPAEQVLLENPGFVDMFLADGLEAARGGPAATVHELGLTAQPWGFRPEEIAVPVRLWQGEQDTSVSPAMGEYLARVIPDCQATFCPGEGHLVGFTHWEEILRAVAEPGL